MIAIHDHVLRDPMAYREATLAQPVRDHEISPDVVFHGISQAVDRTLSNWIEDRYPALTASLSFNRLSPHAQQEPNFIHTDLDMGEWTGILYLTPNPPPKDGTAFWKRKDSGAIRSTALTDDAKLSEWMDWRDIDLWERWNTVPAQFNRLVLFPAHLFHSRAMPHNYGDGPESARLIQIVFGTGDLS